MIFSNDQGIAGLTGDAIKDIFSAEDLPSPNPFDEQVSSIITPLPRRKKDRQKIPPQMQLSSVDTDNYLPACEMPKPKIVINIK